MTDGANRREVVHEKIDPFNIFGIESHIPPLARGYRARCIGEITQVVNREASVLIEINRIQFREGSVPQTLIHGHFRAQIQREPDSYGCAEEYETY